MDSDICRIDGPQSFVVCVNFVSKVFGQLAPAQRQREAERKDMEKALLLLHKIGGAFVNCWQFGV